MSTSDSQYRVGSGWVQIFPLVVGWVGLGWVTQNGPMDNSATPADSQIGLQTRFYRALKCHRHCWQKAGYQCGERERPRSYFVYIRVQYVYAIRSSARHAGCQMSCIKDTSIISRNHVDITAARPTQNTARHAGRRVLELRQYRGRFHPRFSPTFSIFWREFRCIYIQLHSPYRQSQNTKQLYRRKKTNQSY